MKDTESGIPPLLTKNEVMTVLGISVATVQRWMILGILKPIKIGPKGLVRFKASDIAGLLNKGEQ